jgi:hypothetical protein
LCLQQQFGFECPFVVCGIGRTIDSAKLACVGGEKAGGIVVKYACEACGCPTICLPDEFRDDVELRCRGCRQHLGTWAEFRERVKALIMAERDGLQPGPKTSSDPLEVPLLATYWAGRTPGS